VNAFLPDVSTEIADNDEAGAVVTLTGGPLRVFESGLFPGLTVYSYAIVLTRRPEENVQITAAPVPTRESESAAGGHGIALSTHDPLPVGIEPSEAGVTVLFTKDNWFIPQTVYVYAVDDTLAEGRRAINIQHSVIQGGSPKDGGAYDNLAVLGVVVEVIDDDSAQVLILPTGADTTVAEDPNATNSLREDFYYVLLTKEPTGDIEVLLTAIDITDGSSNDDQLVVKDGSGNVILNGKLVFTQGNWDEIKTIKVVANNDTKREANHFSRITHEISAATLNNFLGVTLGGDAGVVDTIGDKINGDLDSRLTAEVTGSTIKIFGPAFAYDLAAPFKNATLTLSGTPVAGENWIITINGKPLVYTVAAGGNTLAQVATALASLIDVVDAVTASPLGNAVTINDATTTILFSLDFTVTGEAVGKAQLDKGAATVTGDRAAVTTISSEKAWDLAKINMAGTIEAGAVWILLLDGVEYRYIAKASDKTLEHIAAGLAAEVKAGGL